MKVAILTISDKGSRGERVDKSGEVIREILTAAGSEIIAYEIVPDEKNLIEEKLILFSDKIGAEVVLTTGGTGFSVRDVTPEATLSVIERPTPGFAEAIRHKSLEVTSHAMLSRATSGIRGKTIIINLPGSPKAVKECLEVIMPALSHGVDILYGRTGECANT
ncbi:MAG: MogA/MoaB family molybdenum cofactor biosynthesis protein [Actinobacteria bacterium]|nr:MogA/MoaB family molybdenum cofactor biosynthesis protein [Actinomycetota bacterium]